MRADCFVSNSTHSSCEITENNRLKFSVHHSEDDQRRSHHKEYLSFLKEHSTDVRDLVFFDKHRLDFSVVLIRPKIFFLGV